MNTRRSKAFKDQPLARKALILGIVPTVCALAVVAVSSVAATYVTARRNLVDDLDTQASILADNVSAALAFGDQGSADGTLRAMRARPNVDAVCVFNAAGALFAGFARDGAACATPRSRTQPPIVVR